MARYNDGTVYNSGARYAVESSSNQPMAIIKINVDGLPLAQKLARGQTIITMETANPNVSGNTAVLAAFSTAQTALQAAEQAALAARETSKQLTAARDALEVEWRNALMVLAAFTESATGGDPVKILTTGFEVRGPATPKPPLEPVMSVNVRLNGSPGHSNLSWQAVAGADGYMVQGSPDPITATSWTPAVISMKTRLKANGAIAGQKYWYRVAAFNAEEQGPWSEVAPRPVM